MNGTPTEINKALLKRYKTKTRRHKRDEDYVMDEYFFLNNMTYQSQLEKIKQGKGKIFHFHVTDIHPNATLSLEAIDVNII
jgi:hypothetical protein